MKRLFPALALMLALLPRAQAATYPEHPISFIVPFAPGGPTDTVGRIFAQHMSSILGQQVEVEDIAGAGGSVGVGRVAHAAPDGYTVSFGNWSTHVVNGAIYSLDYDLVGDFTPVVRLPESPQILVSRKDLPAKDLTALIAWMKGRHVTIGSAGVGSAGHVSAIFLENKTGLPLTIVHYRGAGPAMADLVGGHIDLLFDQSATSLPQVRAGAVKPFAVTSPARLSAEPEIPTVDEAGLKGFYVSVWNGLWLPKGAPADVVAKLNAAARQVMDDPSVRDHFLSLGMYVPTAEETTPAAFAAFQKSEINKWGPILKAADVKAE